MTERDVIGRVLALVILALVLYAVFKYGGTTDCPAYVGKGGC